MRNNLAIRSLFEHLHSGQKVVMSGKTIIHLVFMIFLEILAFLNKFFNCYLFQFSDCNLKRDYSNLPKAGIEMDKIFNQH